MKKDVTQKHYMKKPERVADLCNGYYFQGETVIRPQDVKSMDGNGFLFKGDRSDSAFTSLEHDAVFHVIRGVNCVILGIEQQNYMDPSMVLRSLEYVVCEYQDQRKCIEEEHKNAKDLKGDEYLSRFSVRDLLKPVTVLVVYYGKDEWRGARSLHELLDWNGIPKEWRPMFADYQMQLLEVNKIENLENYHTDLKLLFGIVKYQNDKMKMYQFVNDYNDEFKKVSTDLARVIRQYTHSEEIVNLIDEDYDRNGGTIDMCKAFREMIEDGRAEGRAEGRARGIEQGLNLVMCLLKDNKSDDLKKICEDADYREKLFREYKIVV